MGKKFWARPDQMLLADVKEESGPIDPFKTTFSKVDKKSEVMDKVT